MNPEVNGIFARIVGQPCTRKEVGEHRSIIFGFGDEAPRESRRQHRDYRLWEMGTYGSAWWIVSDGVVVLAKDSCQDAAELDPRLQAIDFGCFSGIQQLSASKLRVNFSNALLMDVAGDTSDDDEYFHLFYPEKQYAEFSEAGWRINRSDEPWSDDVVISL